MIDGTHRLSITRQARLFALSRASAYYGPQPVNERELALMRRIDALHLELPFTGRRLLRDLLHDEGVVPARDNVFVERLWRSVEYEEGYLRAYGTISAVRGGLARYYAFFDQRRPHSVAPPNPDAVVFAALYQIAPFTPRHSTHPSF